MIDKKIIDPRLDSVIADLDKQLINSKPIIRWRVHFLNKSKQSIKPNSYISSTVQKYVPCSYFVFCIILLSQALGYQIRSP